MLHGGGIDVRVPAARGDGRAGLGHRARLHGRARGVRDAPAVGRDRGARQPGRRPTRRSRCCSRAARLVERGSRWLLRNRRRPLDDRRRRCDYFAPGAARALRVDAAAARRWRTSSRWRARADELREAGRAARAGHARGRPRRDVRDVRHRRGGARDRARRGAGRPRSHFRLGSQLQLHWLRDRILALPRDDRWRALARAALRDDLYSLHRALTAEVLRRGRGPRRRRRVEAWIAANPARGALPRRRWPTSASAGCSTSPRCRSPCARCAT